MFIQLLYWWLIWWQIAVMNTEIMNLLSSRCNDDHLDWLNADWLNESQRVSRRVDAVNSHNDNYCSTIMILTLHELCCNDCILMWNDWIVCWLSRILMRREREREIEKRRFLISVFWLVFVWLKLQFKSPKFLRISRSRFFLHLNASQFVSSDQQSQSYTIVYRTSHSSSSVCVTALYIQLLTTLSVLLFQVLQQETSSHSQSSQLAQSVVTPKVCWCLNQYNVIHIIHMHTHTHKLYNHRYTNSKQKCEHNLISKTKSNSGNDVT
jgi:hypothetical protein